MEKTLKRQYWERGVLGGLLVAAAIEYSALFYIADALVGKDYSAIPNPEARAAYCMICSLGPHEKAIIAESMVRPPDNELLGRIVADALRGLPTPQKQAASLALRERDDLRQHALTPVLRVADLCGYNKVVWSLGETPWGIAERWLQRDLSFLPWVDTAKKSPPDAAAQLDKVLTGASRI